MKSIGNLVATIVVLGCLFSCGTKGGGGDDTAHGGAGSGGQTQTGGHNAASGGVGGHQDNAGGSTAANTGGTSGGAGGSASQTGGQVGGSGNMGGSGGMGGTGGHPNPTPDPGIGGMPSKSDSGTNADLGLDRTIQYVFVIVEENAGANDIYKSANAPYINGLMKTYAYATMYTDVIPSIMLSEPHYIWMEAGTNVLPDHAFTGDGDPSAGNSTNSTSHLVTQIKNGAGDSWMAYMEDMPAACPVAASGEYVARHNPFVFFDDVTKDSAYCAAHHKTFTKLASDLGNPKQLARYNFITPNLCNDMHGDGGCSNGCTALSGCVRAGDDWLKTNLPPLVAFANANHGVIFVTWDESEGAPTQAFLAIGPNVKPGANTTLVNHSALLKSIEQIMNVPVLPTVGKANDLSSFFVPGTYP